MAKRSASSTFIHYPEITDEDFYENIYWKKEFNKTKSDVNIADRKPRDLCNKDGEFKIQPNQEFVKNFMSPGTPYNGLLIFHGTGVGKTCAAIGITEGARDYLQKMGKKIFILAKPQIQPNFYRELYDSNRERKEKETNSLAGSYQCAGDRYYLTGTKYDKDIKAKEAAIRKNIRNYYSFMGYGSFVNIVEKIKKKYITEEEIKVALAEYFDNTLIVIDEAHNIAHELKQSDYAGDVVEEKDGADGKPTKRKGKGKAKTKSGKKISKPSKGTRVKLKKADDEEETKKKKKPTPYDTLIEIITACREVKGGHLKLVLMTATPMRDRYKEIGYILSLLNNNDGQEFDMSRITDSVPENEKEDYLRTKSRGYISYVRGNNPISFPESRLPDESLLYTPKPLFTTQNTDAIEAYDEIKTKIGAVPETDFKFNLVKCPMSWYQFMVYLYEKGMKDDGKAKGVQALQVVSAMCYPDPLNFGKIITGEKDLTSVPPKDELFEIDTDSDNFRMRDTKLKFIGEGQFEDSLKVGDGLFNLGTFSNKFSKFVENLNSTTGIAYCYTFFLEAGTEVLVNVLEHNGYIHFNEKRDYHSKDDSRCALCTAIKVDHDELFDHEFVQATFIVKSGSIKKYKEFDYVRDPENKDGSIIRIVLGTKATSEGIDFKWVRQIHILDPWFNNTIIYQAIGRGIRHCSHIDLPPEDRNVTIYKYAATVPEIDGWESAMNLYNDAMSEEGADEEEILNQRMTQSYDGDDGEVKTFEYNVTLRDMLTETNDEKIYRMAILKELETKKVERILKEEAVDCQLNKKMNIYGSEHDIDYSRECEYQKCDYKCSWVGDEEVDDDGEVDHSTYNINFAQPQIYKAIKIISRMFTRHIVLNQTHIIALVGLVDPSIDYQFVLLAIDQMVGNPPFIKPVTITDRYSRTGRLVYKNKFYVFQPDEMDNMRIPPYYRGHPFKYKPSFKKIEGVSKATVEDEGDLAMNYDDMDEYIKSLKSIDLSGLKDLGDPEDLNKDYFGRMTAETTPADLTRRIEGLKSLAEIDQDLDKLVLKELGMFIEQYFDGTEEEATGAAEYALTWFLMNKFMRMSILYRLDDTNELLHLLSVNEIRKRSPEDYKWTDIQSKSEYIKIINDYPEKVLDDSFFCFIKEPGNQKKVLVITKINGHEKYGRISEAVQKMGTYTKKNISKMQFKILDNVVEKKVTTKTGRLSNKQKPTGQVCSSFTQETIKKKVINLHAFYDDGEGDDDEPEVIKFVGVGEASGKPESCSAFEFLTRMTNILDFKRKWFLSPFEVILHGY